MMKRSVSRFLGMALTGCLAAAGLSLLSASDVSAASYPSEVLLGTFWESDNNTTDTVYWSTDGVNFYEPVSYTHLDVYKRQDQKICSHLPPFLIYHLNAPEHYPKERRYRCPHTKVAGTAYNYQWNDIQ